MANFILSYDLNGHAPSHADIDEHLLKLPGEKARLLETVWYVAFPGSAEQLRQYMDMLLSANDQVLVVEAVEAAWRNILVEDQALKNAWHRNQRRNAA
ncbi:hypothetical protein [Oceanicaulis sp.]|uniref:hypothetical protein n=1 Tax=Oceanicaulis sp. TaxID=1924941 RepID=UPI003D297E75